MLFLTIHLRFDRGTLSHRSTLQFPDGTRRDSQLERRQTKPRLGNQFVAEAVDRQDGAQVVLVFFELLCAA